mgnify:CR=1 FL=1
MSDSAPALLADRAAFEGLLRQLLHQGQDGSFGRLHIVRLGLQGEPGQWAHLLPKAMAIAENILHRRLTAADACLRLADGRYMLLFPTLSEMEGRLRATAITAEIRQHLSGSQAQGVEVTTEVLPLSALGPADEASVEGMNKAANQAAAHPAIALDVGLQPVWDHDRQALVGSRARICRHLAGQTLWDRAVLLGGDEDPLAGELNRRMAQAGAAFRPDRGLLFLPLAINAHTLGDGHGLDEALHGACRTGGERLVVELAGTVGSVGRPALRTLIAAIRAHGAAVAARVLPEAEIARFLRQSGVDYLCLDHLQAQSAGFGASAVHALYTLIAHDLGALGFRLCLWNATSPQDIKRAAALGFRLFSGPPLGPTAAQAVPLRPLATAAVFA